KVRVVQSVTGGGFGGKEEYPSILSCHAALLALKAGRPVKMIYDRSEDLAATTRRHPSVVTVRTAVAEDGELLAWESDVALDGGAYTTLSPVVLSRALIHAVGPYRCEHAFVSGDIVATNTPPNGAFRGFGAPQVCFAVERHMDRIARAVGRDPVDLRRQLALRLGDTTLTGQVLESSVASDEVLDKALAAADWDRRRQEAEESNARGGSPTCRPVAGLGATPRLRGVGMSFFFHGAGFTGNGEARIRGRVRAELKPDGGILLYSASTDIGQGTRTIFPQIAAKTIGIPIGLVDLHEPDTAQVPDSGPTVASRTCMVVGKVVEDCAAEIRRRVLGEGEAGAIMGEDAWRAAAKTYLSGGGEASIELEYQTDDSVEWDNDTYQGEAYPCYAWACDVVEVEVDPDTMEVGSVGFWSAQDVGKAIHPILVEGQLEGGSLQALGFATVAEMHFSEGHLLNNRMTNYIIPTALDAPEMDIRLVESPFEGGPFGAKGIGELPMDGGAPAVLAAVEHATGISLDVLPASPERLLAAAAERARG
ncbi:MAG: molybdopterin cofactor-binding domain-containing protein, partial [Myxococcota bacterium]|nr:molybdopterin cofactor-binding domain-containing protein [Myxococcota bacterium]